MRPEKAPEISCFESLWTSPSTISMLSLLMCTCHACHTCRDLDYCSKQGRVRGTSQRAIIATYHRSVKTVEGFYWFGINSFFPVQLGCYGYGSHCKVFCYACKVFCHANMNVTLFRVSANQISVFSITQQSQYPNRKEIKCNTTKIPMQY